MRHLQLEQKVNIIVLLAEKAVVHGCPYVYCSLKVEDSDYCDFYT